MENLIFECIIVMRYIILGSTYLQTMIYLYLLNCQKVKVNQVVRNYFIQKQV